MGGYNPNQQANQDSLSVSMIQLIANPQRYDGMQIRVIGFLHLTFEGDNLYLHREDFEYGISKNAVWINRPHDLSTEQVETLNEKYAICEGIFRSEHLGHMAANSGAISHINRLQVWLSGESRSSLIRKALERG